MSAPAEPILEVRDLTVRYGGLVANDAVTITVRRGQLVGLVGPNGAGKTTTLDAMSGLTRSSGSVLFEGNDLAGLSPHRRARAGLVRTFQSLELFEDLTVLENVAVAASSRGTSSGGPKLRRGLRAAFGRGGDVTALSARAVDDVGLGEFRDVLPRQLPQGVRKLIGVARALGSAPRCLLLDEPAGGLDSVESEVFGARLRALVDGGLSALLIEHDMGLVFSVCDYIYVLEFGKIIAHGTPDEVRRDPKVVAAYLGERAAQKVTEHVAEMEEVQ